MNVLIIPEDFRTDQYILKPIISRMFQEIGKKNANVRVLTDPLLGGVDQAMNWGRLEEILKRYRMVDVFLLIVDRDGKEHRDEALANLEKQGRELLGEEKRFLAVQAGQEVEVWALAGQELPGEWRWNEIRAEANPKEVYFQPLAEDRKLTNEPGAGRTTMGREAALNYARVRSLCDEVKKLESRLKEWIESRRE